MPDDPGNMWCSARASKHVHMLGACMAHACAHDPATLSPTAPTHLRLGLAVAEHEHRVAVPHRLVAQPRRQRAHAPVGVAVVGAAPVCRHIQLASQSAVLAEEVAAHLRVERCASERGCLMEYR